MPVQKRKPARRTPVVASVHQSGRTSAKGRPSSVFLLCDKVRQLIEQPRRACGHRGHEDKRDKRHLGARRADPRLTCRHSQRRRCAMLRPVWRHSLLESGRIAFPCLRHVFADGGYASVKLMLRVSWRLRSSGGRSPSLVSFYIMVPGVTHLADPRYAIAPMTRRSRKTRRSCGIWVVFEHQRAIGESSWRWRANQSIPGCEHSPR